MTTFWEPTFRIDHRGDGTILMTQDGALPVPPRSMPDRLVHWAEHAPERCFLAARDGDDWRKVSYSDALMQVRKLGAGLLALGLGPEKPLLILSGNDIEHALLGLAAQYVGVPYAPVSPAYALVSSDYGKLRDIAELLTPGAIFATDGNAFRPALDAIAKEAQVIVTQHPQGSDLTFGTLLQNDPTGADAAFDALAPESVGKYLFTSGSTGSPKAVINTQYMMTSNQMMIADCFRFLAEKPPVVVEWAPWNHTAGGNKVFNMVLHHGGTFHIDGGKPTPQGIATSLRNLREIAPTWHFNVPVAYEMLVRAFDDDTVLRDNFFSRLDMMMYAGAGMAQHVWDDLRRHARAATGHEVLLSSGLGATETGPFALMGTTPQDHAGNIGVPAKGITLKLVPMEGKLDARLKSPSITPGYLGDAKATAAALDEDGFYKLGDALRPADPEDLTKGFFFDGRTAENFKLDTGTWVAVGALRAAMINHFGGLIRDAVITGEDRPFLGAIVLPDLAALRRIGTGETLEALLGEETVRAAMQEKLTSFAAKATGSSNRIKRMVVMTEAPDLDKGEVTDKGSVNQRAVLRHRTGLVEAIYTGDGTVLSA